MSGQDRGSKRGEMPRRSGKGLSRADAERERLARLLRENLKKRKTQQRSRAGRARDPEAG